MPESEDLDMRAELSVVEIVSNPAEVDAANAVQGTAQGAKLLSETDTQNPNALTNMLQRGSTIV